MMVCATKVFALVPAAGQSRRMGRPKLTLPLGQRSVIEHVVDALRRAELDQILVVAGPSTPELGDRVRSSATVLRLENDTPDMRATASAGIAWLAENRHPASNDAVILALADHPSISSSVTRTLIEAHERDGRSILVPVYAGERGHPVLFPWSIIASVDSLPSDCGLNHLLKAHEAIVFEIETAESTVLEDLDDPEDYERLNGRPW